jgi:REP element-mobilizing transposase RayT
MVIGHHLIWTVYGWWLPNDPRGSSSHEIQVERIAELGELHYGRKPIQPPAEELREFHHRAGEALSYPVLTFDSDDMAVVAASLRETIRLRNYTCYACAIMPEHVHLLIRRHRDLAEEMLAAFQDATREAIVSAGRRPAWHPIWGGPGWKVFQSSPRQMENTIRYVTGNPAKHGLPPQQWDFVLPYDGWLPGRFGARK